MILRHRAAVLAVAIGVAAVPLAAVPLAAAGTTASGQPGPGSVAVRVLDVSTISPAPSATPQSITVRLQLTNNGDTPLNNLTIDGARGNPIANQPALDAAIAKPAPPDPTLAASFSPEKPITLSLPAGATRQIDYLSSVSLSAEGPGLCLCQNLIYPLYFAVHANVDGGDVVVGSAQSFVVSFPSAPEPVRVGWVWPILEPPHRIARDDLFTDDSLATSVIDGRLARLLTVVEAVATRVPLTLVLDPELIDELAVMATGHYSVLRGDGATTPGGGAQAAKQWLGRLRAVLDGSPSLQLVFTAPADPDVTSLVAAGLRWSARPTRAAAGRITTALGDRTGATLASWPARQALSAPALQELARSGVSVALLSPEAVEGADGAPGRAGAGPRSVPTPFGPVLVPASTSGIATAVGKTLPAGGEGAAALPELVAQVAVHAVADPRGSPFVAVVPPANLDPDPAVAERAILATTTTPWATGVSLQSAATTPAAGRLTNLPVDGALPAQTIATAQRVAAQVPGLITLFGQVPGKTPGSTPGSTAGSTPGDTPGTANRSPTGSEALLNQLPQAVQRSESAAWLPDPEGSIRIAAAVTSILDQVQTSVHVVRPANGSYTLGSTDSPLPITVQNTLPVPVSVRVSVSAVGGIYGFRAEDVGVQQVAAGAKLALHVPVTVDRAGRIKVRVQLLTPAGTSLGDPVVLSVRSTALGDIGKMITAIAGGVLALALLVRFLRWAHRRRRSRAEARA